MRFLIPWAPEYAGGSVKRFVFVLVAAFACAPAATELEYQAVLPDGRTAQVEVVAPEWARSRTALTSMPTVVCSGPGECRQVLAMRACPAPASIVCFDPDQTKCVQCAHAKFVLRLTAK
jgi:hypothetical protein